MADLERLSKALAMYSLVVLIGSIASVSLPVDIPLASEILYLFIGGFPAAILFFLYRSMKGRSEELLHEILLLLTPVVLSPLAGFFIALAMWVYERNH